MKFSNAVSISILFGLSSPLPSDPFHPPPITNFDYIGSLPAANVSVEENLWAGAIIDKEPFYWVGAKLRVPAAKVPLGGNASLANCFTMWTGVGGDCNTMLQVGLTACIKDGKPIYRTWTSVNPGPVYKLVDIKEGDEITMGAITVGDFVSVEIDNLTTGKNGSYHHYEGVLCRHKALWMVQPYSAVGCALADFSTVAFTDTFAEAAGDNKIYTISNATLFEIKEDNEQVTKTSNTDTVVVVEYTG
ncbi:uncharacterized protein TRUGW13939_04475 [Talaromyces rugulosus]|uniref:Concanavalin A-like lectin/glucanase n=1 Tax=Talaromyces rugulosus TaxID=121627 RepID=A0A7H8QX29_TALRU|nr:uncharacterized protein TRUGW13939_04475 [Talaromyces rugulosus]QKX57363.1 hypothetical protein TRUGW13939_04475 [Talaromyces rugulosus]